MSTKRIVLRQHIRGSESRPTTNLNLSLGEQEISYSIILIPLSDQLEIVEGDTVSSHGCAKIHTQYGFVCVEAMEPIIKVQSLPSGFDGTSSNGIMQLQVSVDNRRVLYQLHPGESLFVGSHTISIVPEAYHGVPILTSGYDNFREHVSQHVSQMQSSLKMLETPIQNRVRSMLSSPSQLRTLVKPVAAFDMNGNNDSQEWSSDPTKRNLLGVIRDVSRKRNQESPRGDSSNPEYPITSAVNFSTSIHGENNNRIVDLQSDYRADDVIGQVQTEDHVIYKRKAENDDENAVTLRFSRSPVSRADSSDPLYDHPHRDECFEPEEAVEADFSNEDVHSVASRTDNPKPSKHQKVIKRASSSPVEETQDSMRSNIVVQGRAHPRKNANQQASSNNRAVSLEITKASEAGTERHQSKDTKPSPRSIAPDSSMRSTRSAAKEKLSSSQSPSTSIRILFGSSTLVDSSKQCMRFLEKQGVKRVSNVADCTALCVGRSSELKKTSKLIMAVLHGKQVVTDDWVTKSVTAGKLLNLGDFKARDPRREAEWGIDLDQAVERGRQTAAKPFDGWTIAFTSAAKKNAGTTGFNDLKEIALYAGAKSCSAVLPKKSPEQSPLTLVIGCQNDPASAMLKGTSKHFTRDIIGLSSLRGQLDIKSDEFLVRSEPETPKGRDDRKRKR